MPSLNLKRKRVTFFCDVIEAVALKSGPRPLLRAENSRNASLAVWFLWQQVMRVETVAEVACLLQAVELILQVRDQLRAIGLMHSLQKSVLGDGSPTGIL